MGLDSDEFAHLCIAAWLLDNSSIEKIDELAEPLSWPQTPFSMLPEFENLGQEFVAHSRVTERSHHCAGAGVAGIWRVARIGLHDHDALGVS